MQLQQGFAIDETGFRVKSHSSNRRAQMSALGQKADIAASPTDVRFTPKSGHWNSAAKCPLCAKSRHSSV